MANGTTQQTTGRYVKFQAAVIEALPRDIDPEVALGWINNGESLSRILRGALMPAQEMPNTVNEFLRLISNGKYLTLGACDGSQIIADAKDVFQAGIDSAFRKWKADEPGQATSETEVQVYELAKDATFSQMFGSASNDLNKLCLTQSQIIGFVKKHRQWLRKDGYATFLLFKSNDQFFVTHVHVNDSGFLNVDVARFEYDDVWVAVDRDRVVLPQLA